MGSTNYGTQTINFSYGQELLSSSLGGLLHNLIKPGVYDGGNLTINAGNNVNIAPLDVAVETSLNQLVHVKTSATIVFPITEAKPYITCQFTWINSATNYMDFTAKAVGELLSTDVIIGMGVYVVNVLTSFDYTSKTWGLIDRSGNVRTATSVITPTITASTDVTILGANGLYNSTKALTTYGNATSYKQATYVGLGNDGINRLEFDTTAGACTYTLPLMANNRRRRIEIAYVKGGTNTLTINPHATDANKISNDLLASIILPKVGNILVLQESVNSGCWEIVSERITSQLKLRTYAGYGSTDNRIMRFTNVDENIGNMFSENHSSGYSSNAKGLEITINRSGVYSYMCMHGADGGDINWGLSLNSNQLTTIIQSITTTDIVSMAYTQANTFHQLSGSMYFKKGDIFRPHTIGNAPNDAAKNRFTFVYLGQ